MLDTAFPCSRINNLCGDINGRVKEHVGKGNYCNETLHGDHLAAADGCKDFVSDTRDNKDRLQHNGTANECSHVEGSRGEQRGG